MTDLGSSGQTDRRLECSTQERAYRAVMARIDRAAKQAGRSGADVRLLAVSKGQHAAAIEELCRLGQRDFGESYLQEALPKIARFGDKGLVWHFIGPMQTSKCRDVAAHFDWIHSLDRAAHADRLDRRRPAHLPPLQVCLQVKLSLEPRKSGVDPDQLLTLARHVDRLPRLRLRGLMAIPEASQDPTVQRAAYARLMALFCALRAAGHDLDTLSMGMSDDLEAAILEGSTLIRVGRALFGARKIG